MADVRALLAALLSAQPTETLELTLSLAELEALADAPLPRGAYARRFWMDRGDGKVNTALAQIGWRFVGFDRDAGAVTLGRLPESAAS